MTSTQKHSSKDWADRKGKILRLLNSVETLDKVKAEMEKDGFKATKSQYETQLEKWGHRKYLKPHEWALLLPKLDEATRNGAKARVVISGRPIEPASIKRHRRRCKNSNNTLLQGHGTAHTVCLPGVSIEQLRPDGSWASFAKFDVDHTTFTFPDESCTSGALLAPQQGHTKNFPKGLWQAELLPDIETIDNDIHSAFDIHEPSERFVDVQRTFTDESQSFFGSRSSFLSFQNLPFTKFVREMGLQLTDFHNSYDPFSMPETYDNIQNCGLVRHFVEEIVPIAATHICDRRLESTPAYSETISNSLADLVIHQNEDIYLEAALPLITGNGSEQTKLIRALIFALMNGFAGLDGVPAQTVLKYLGQSAGIQSLFSQYLKSSKSHAGRCLAENLFRAAIEAKDEKAMQYLIDTGLIDINKISCAVNGQNYMPVDRVCMLLHTPGLMVLINAGLVIEDCQPAPLNTLIQSLLLQPLEVTRISEHAIDFCFLLLKKGTGFNPYLVKKFICRFLLPEQLCNSLTRAALQADHSTMIRPDVPSPQSIGLNWLGKELIGKLDDVQVTAAFETAFRKCQEMKCHDCAPIWYNRINIVIVKAATTGYIQLLKLLLAYFRRLWPHRLLHASVLVAAIQYGDQELITMVLNAKVQLEPILRKVKYQQEFEWELPLGAAIIARNMELTRMFEENGSFSRLGEGNRFGHALAAAVKAGDWPYINKLIERYPDASPSDLGTALTLAVEKDDLEMTRLLIQAGAEVGETGFQTYYDDNGDGDYDTDDDDHVIVLDDYQPAWTNLNIALKNQNCSIIRELLHHGIPCSTRSILPDVASSLARLASRSVIETIFTSTPELVFNVDCLEMIRKAGNMELFEYIISSERVLPRMLTRSLHLVLDVEDGERLVEKMVQLGADIAGSGILKDCAIKYTNKLPFLLKLMSQPRRRIIPRTGTRALVDIIMHDQGQFGALSLVDSGLVDLKAIAGRVQGGSITPLGAAIETWSSLIDPSCHLINTLLDAGCSPNSIVRTTKRNANSQTALLTAIKTKNRTVVELLIKRGAEVNKEAILGIKRTPLQQAAELGSLKIVTLLLSKGAQVNAEPAKRGGGTALQMAAIAGYCSIAATLIEHGADIWAEPSEVHGRRPLEGAAEYGRSEMIEYLWRMTGSGFDDKQCHRAMKLARSNGHIGCNNLIEELMQSRDGNAFHTPRTESLLIHSGFPTEPPLFSEGQDGMIDFINL